MRKTLKVLSETECQVLYKIARKTRMDCWFDIRQDSFKKDYIYDLEERKKLSLSNGIKQLVEGLDCQENFDNCFLAWYEKVTLRNLLAKLCIKVSFDWKLPEFFEMNLAKFISLYDEAKIHNVACSQNERTYKVDDVNYCFNEGNVCVKIFVETDCAFDNRFPHSTNDGCVLRCN